MKWISVEDRLPEAEQFVDVFVNRIEGYKLRITDVEYYPDMKNPWQHNDLSLMDDITHWMPLSEPPK